MAPELPDKNEVIFKKAAARAAENIDAFISFVFQVDQAPCHVEMQAHMDAWKRAFILAHKELGKTTQCLGRVLFELGKNPNLRIKVICADDDSASDRVIFLRDMITRNRRLHMVFPNLKRHETVEDWGKKSFTVQRDLFSKDSSVEAAGIMTSGTGQRADLILFDDVCNFQNAIQFPLEREKVKHAFKNVWIPTLGPTGRAVYIANRHHELDLTSEIEKQTAVWHLLDMSVTGDPPVSPWKERWTSEALEERRIEIGDIEFDRTMRNILHPESDRKIQEAWIRRFSVAPDKRDQRFISWDYGGTGPNSDYTAYTVGDLNLEERRIYIRKMDRRKSLTFNQQIEWWIEVFNEWHPDLVLSEEVGFQIVIGADERIVGQYPIERIVPTMNKEQRILMTGPLYERGFILFKDGECEVGIKELINFPNAPNDDCADSITHLVLYCMSKFTKFFKPGDSKAANPRSFTTNSQPMDGQTAQDVVDENDERPRSVRANFRSAKW